MTLTNHPDGPHGFDNEVDDARSREIVLETLEFLKRHLLGSDGHGRTPAEHDSATDADLFTVRFTTGPGWDASKPFPEQKRAAEHSANLRRMREEGLIAFGGRFADIGLIVVRAPDEAAVRSQLARDPSLEAGTFRVAVDEYRPFFAPAAPPPEPAETTEVEVVRRAIAAFNAHDADAFAALCAEDVKWLGIAGDSLSVDGAGRESIREWLAGHFESLPEVRSEVSGLAQAGAHVAFHERVTWTAGDGSPSVQSALGVYEIRDGAFRRAWYFPSER